MPCHDAYAEGPGRQWSASVSADLELTAEVARLRGRVEELARMLCEAAQALPAGVPLSPGLTAWVTEHRALDASEGRPWADDDGPVRAALELALHVAECATPHPGHETHLLDVERAARKALAALGAPRTAPR